MIKKGILVTGGSGLVGVHVVALLQSNGERPVVYDAKVNRDLLKAVGVDLSTVPLVQGNVLDRPGLVSVIREHRIDRVIHLAGLTGEEVQRHPHKGVEVNVMGTMNLLEAAGQESISRVTYASSGSVYLRSLEQGTQTINEAIAVNPPSIYAATKASSEFLGQAYAEQFGFEFVSVRYVGGLYGPSPVSMKSAREQAIAAMVRAALTGKTVTIQWPEGTMELVYARDAAKGTVLACLTDNLKDRLFHIGSGELLVGEDFGRALEKLFSGVSIKVQNIKRSLPHPEIRVINDNSRSRAQLGYKPEYPLEKALTDYARTLESLGAGPHS